MMMLRASTPRASQPDRRAVPILPAPASTIGPSNAKEPTSSDMTQHLGDQAGLRLGPVFRTSSKRGLPGFPYLPIRRTGRPGNSAHSPREPLSASPRTGGPSPPRRSKEAHGGTSPDPPASTDRSDRAKVAR